MKFYLLYFLLLFAITLQAQVPQEVNAYADSLLKKVEKTNNQEEKIEQLFELSYFWSDYDTTKALHYINEAQKLIPSNNNLSYYKGITAFYTAGVYFEQDRKQALEKYLEAEEFLKKVNTTKAYRYRARLWGNYGALLQREGRAQDYVDAVLNKTIPLAKKIQDTVLIGNNYQNVALVLMNQKNYQLAEKYYKEAVNLLRYTPKAYEERLTAYVNLARNALFQQNQPLARTSLDSAAIAIKVLKLSPYAPMYYSVEGTFWQQKGQYQKAVQYFDQGLKTARQLNKNHLVHYILYEKFELYKVMDDFKSAKAVLFQVYSYVKETSSLPDKQTVYYNLAYVESKLGDLREAVKWYEAYKSITDSISNHEGIERVLDLEKKYQTAEKENELLTLKNQSQQQQLRIEKNKLWISILTAVTLIALVLGAMLWKMYQHKNKVALKNQELHQKELKALKQQEQLNLYNAMVQGQEEERNRIARDLHDGLGGMLAGVKLKLSAMASKSETASTKHPDMELYNVINQLDNSVSELRRIARNMMPESLLYMGLEPALSDLCKALDNDTMQVKFEAINLRKDYEQPFLIAVYRIVQELLTNAVKHAEAQHIIVQCSEHEKHFYITVEDDGKGFDVAAAQKAVGIGLSNIKNRIDLLSGKMEIDSQKGKGSTFNIDIDLYGN